MNEWTLHNGLHTASLMKFLQEISIIVLCISWFEEVVSIRFPNQYLIGLSSSLSEILFCNKSSLQLIFFETLFLVAMDPCNWVSLQLHLLKYYLWKWTKLLLSNGIFNVTEASTNWSVEKFCKPNVPCIEHKRICSNQHTMTISLITSHPNIVNLLSNIATFVEQWCFIQNVLDNGHLLNSIVKAKKLWSSNIFIEKNWS